MGILGTGASTVSDINLIVQIIIVALLAEGWVISRDKKRIRLHGQLMVAAVLINAAAIALVMVPSLILGLGAITSDPFGPGPLITIAHVSHRSRGMALRSLPELDMGLKAGDG